ncbi:MAG: hypothetical protein IT381_13595 [Deltaproteobacteria bacterium]|nr:hypothetical protein [Deltaproteobacteria bacterium]
MTAPIGSGRIPGSIPTTPGEAPIQAPAAKTTSTAKAGTPSNVDVLGEINKQTSTEALTEALLGPPSGSGGEETLRQLAADINVSSLTGAAVLGQLAALQGNFPSIQFPNAGSTWAGVQGFVENERHALNAEHLEKLSALAGLAEAVTTAPNLRFAATDAQKAVVDSVAPNATQLTDEARLEAGEVVIPGQHVVAMESALRQSVLGDMANADIEMLVILIMQECSRDNNDELRSMMAEMKAVNQTKKAIREYQNWLTGVKATWQKAALDEYRTRQADGRSPPDETFTEFCSGLTMTLPTQTFKPNATPTDDGAPSNQTGLPDPQSINFSFDGYKSPGQVRKERKAMDDALSASASKSVGDIEPLTEKEAIEYAKLYGIMPEDVQQFWAFHQSHGAEEKLGDFETWLEEGNGKDVLKGPGLAPAGNGDGHLDPGNQAKIDTFVGTLAELGRTATGEIDAKRKALQDQKAALADMSNKTPEQLKSMLADMMFPSPDTAEAKAARAQLGVTSKADVATKVDSLVERLVQAQLKLSHATKESIGQAGAQAELDTIVTELKALTAKMTPAMNMALAGAVNKKIAALSDHLSVEKNQNNWTSCGDGGGPNEGGHDGGGTGSATDIVSAQAVAGSAGEVGSYDVWVDASGGVGGTYVDPDGIADCITKLAGWVSSGIGDALKPPSQYMSQAESELQTKIDALGPAGTKAPDDVWAGSWAKARKRQDKDGFAVDAGSSDPSAQVGARVGGGGGGGYVPPPDFQGATSGSPYDVTTSMRNVSFDQLSAEVDKAKSQLDSMSEISEEMSMRLQMKMDLKSKIATTLSNILNKMAKTQEGITQNLK